MGIRFSFSLKTLLLLVAAVGVLCAYHARWIQERHALLKEYAADKRVYYAHKHTFGTGAVFPRSAARYSLVLWLLGEPSHELIDVMIPTSQVRYYGNDLETSSVEERRRAARLFPESDLYVHMYGLDQPLSDEPD